MGKAEEALEESGMRVLVLTEEQLTQLLYVGEEKAVVESVVVFSCVDHAFHEDKWEDPDEENFPGSKQVLEDCRKMARELIAKRGQEVPSTSAT